MSITRHWHRVLFTLDSFAFLSALACAAQMFICSTDWYISRHCDICNYIESDEIPLSMRKHKLSKEEVRALRQRYTRDLIVCAAAALAASLIWRAGTYLFLVFLIGPKMRRCLPGMSWSRRRFLDDVNRVELKSQHNPALAFQAYYDWRRRSSVVDPYYERSEYETSCPSFGVGPCNHQSCFEGDRRSTSLIHYAHSTTDSSLHGLGPFSDYQRRSSLGSSRDRSASVVFHTEYPNRTSSTVVFLTACNGDSEDRCVLSRTSSLDGSVVTSGIRSHLDVDASGNRHVSRLSNFRRVEQEFDASSYFDQSSSHASSWDWDQSTPSRACSNNWTVEKSRSDSIVSEPTLVRRRIIRRIYRHPHSDREILVRRRQSSRPRSEVSSQVSRHPHTDRRIIVRRGRSSRPRSEVSSQVLIGKERRSDSVNKIDDKRRDKAKALRSKLSKKQLARLKKQLAKRKKLRTPMSRRKKMVQKSKLQGNKSKVQASMKRKRPSSRKDPRPTTGTHRSKMVYVKRPSNRKGPRSTEGRHRSNIVLVKRPSSRKGPRPTEGRHRSNIVLVKRPSSRKGPRPTDGTHRSQIVWVKRPRRSNVLVSTHTDYTSGLPFTKSLPEIKQLVNSQRSGQASDFIPSERGPRTKKRLSQLKSQRWRENNPRNDKLIVSTGPQPRTVPKKRPIPTQKLQNPKFGQRPKEFSPYRTKIDNRSSY